MTKHTLKKDKDFVQIPNSILINPNISLKAKGILALMLSLPTNWDFSIGGIASKCKESRDCISAAIKELETAGYIKRTKFRGADGIIMKMEYEIFEEPYTARKSKAHSDQPCEEIPCTEKLITDNPTTEYPLKENNRVNNTIINKKENNNILYKNTQSNHIQSKNSERDETKIYKDVIKKNIEYDALVENNSTYKDMIDEIVNLMAETLGSEKETITIASRTLSMSDVLKRFMDISYEHIEYIIKCICNNAKKVQDVKQYVLTIIYNAPRAVGNYYTTHANYDLYG